jgi:hypothetical protein
VYAIEPFLTIITIDSFCYWSHYEIIKVRIFYMIWMVHKKLLRWKMKSVTYVISKDKNLFKEEFCHTFTLFHKKYLKSFCFDNSNFNFFLGQKWNSWRTFDGIPIRLSLIAWLLVDVFRFLPYVWFGCFLFISLP